MKTTPFTDKHIALGAKMHEFAGYNMPIEYSGIIDEHLTVCNAVGVFDVSHMGEFWVKGPGALPFLQKITSNNVAALAPGKVQYTCFPNEEGGIVDDLLVYQYDPQKYLLVVNASNIEKDWNWCVAHNTEGAELENSSDRTAQLAVQGPKAILALQKLTDIDLSDIPYYTFKVGEIAGEKNVIISNTGYTVQEVSSCISIRTLLIRYGTQFLKLARNSGSSLSGWVPVIRFGLKWDFACTAMFWMIPHLLLKRGWGGLRNLWMGRILLTVRCLRNKRPKEPYVNWLALR